MTDPTELNEDDAFWAEARAEDAAARGKQADPSACGTCRSLMANGKQVEHDECAKRATLLKAPDAPDYELITGLSEAELRALPPRFHTPVFMDTCTPKGWACAVCWGDGWNTSWPCATATEHGTRVFTPEHHAEREQTALRAEVTLLQGRFDKAIAGFNAQSLRVTELEAEADRRPEPLAESEQSMLASALEPAHGRLTIAVYRTRAERALQVQIAQLGPDGIGVGYRLAGPKHYNAGTTELISRELDADDATEIRAMLDDVFPVRPPLTEAERRFLSFALDQAAEEMFLNDGFTDDDEAALESLRRLAAEGGVS